MNDTNSLAHTKWNCKYHIVFAPKYRRKIFYGEQRAEIGKILRELCSWKQVNIVEAEVCPDHIHTKWNCKYHVVFAPKYRRKVFFGEKRREIGEILRTLCNWKKVKIVETEICPDHVHMLLEIPPKVAISSFIGYLKGKSSLMLYEKFPELKYKYRNREFWCKGYYVNTVGKDAQKIQEHIKRQLEEDKAGEQLTMGNF